MKIAQFSHENRILVRPRALSFTKHSKLRKIPVPDANKFGPCKFAVTFAKLPVCGPYIKRYHSLSSADIRRWRKSHLVAPRSVGNTVPEPPFFPPDVHKSASFDSPFLRFGPRRSPWKFRDVVFSTKHSLFLITTAFFRGPVWNSNRKL